MTPSNNCNANDIQPVNYLFTVTNFDLIVHIFLRQTTLILVVLSVEPNNCDNSNAICHHKIWMWRWSLVIKTVDT